MKIIRRTYSILLKLLLVGALASLSSFIFCSEDSLLLPPEPIEGFSILSVSLPDTFWITQNYNFKVTATVEGELQDPNVLPLSVVGEVTFPNLPFITGSMNMFDRGGFQDNAPNDFIFTSYVSVRGAFGFFTGTAQVEFFVSRALLPVKISDSVIKTVTVLQGSRNFPPTIFNLGAPNSVDITQSDFSLFTVNIFEPNGINDLNAISGSLYFPQSPSPNLTISMNDDGLDGDIVAQDSIFTGKINHDQLIGNGVYTLLVIAEDQDGEKSNDLFKEINFIGIIEPTAPEIVSITLPDSLQAGSDPLLIEVEVSDANGLTDIETVFFDSILPGGAPSSSNPFVMHDDGGNQPLPGGTSGDRVQGDGIYSLTITIPAGTEGTFTFKFKVRDKSGLESDFIDREIVIF